MSTDDSLLRQNLWRNLGLYYAYGECIECRLVSLESLRDYVRFYNLVFRYLALSLGPIEMIIRQKDDYEEKFWDFASRMHAQYGRALEKLQILADDPYKTSIRGKVGLNKYNTLANVNRGYMVLSAADGQKCAYADKISGNGRSTCPINPDILDEKITPLLKTLIRSNNLYERLEKTARKHADLISRRMAGGVANRYAPEQGAEFQYNVYASKFVFTSHFGRAAILSMAGEYDAADQELHNSVHHLDRAIMDSHKNLIKLIARKRIYNRFKQTNSGAFWRNVIIARRMEHDRCSLNDRIDQYNRVFESINQFVGTYERFVEERLTKRESDFRTPKNASPVRKLAQKIGAIFTGVRKSR